MRPSENGFGEPELDANSALTELDKGLRSQKIGEQCEAIVRFPALFERYPFPILINSAFLKFTDVFRAGSNFLRLWILRVCQQSERHLEKILNVDEFIRRIFSVIHSNDPVARALTLRTLGSLSGLIPERNQVHHSIRVALDSHDRVEVSAAIYAASCFAKRSKTFGTTMCTKIATMVQKLSTPVDLKLRLIPIFQHMHHDVSTALMVRKLCKELLVNYPSEEFVTTTLHTLTQLAAATISDLSEQVSFLLANLEDPRPKVKLSILKDLEFLGDKGGHQWSSQHVSLLLNSILSHYENKMDQDGCASIDVDIILTTLDVISSITSSSAILTYIFTPESKLWNLLETSIKSSDLAIALKAVQISTYIVSNWKDYRIMLPNQELQDLATEGIESLLNALVSLTIETTDAVKQEKLTQDLERCLSYAVHLSKTHPTKADWVCNLLVQILNSKNLNARSKNIICQTIGSVGSFNQDSILKVLPDLLTILENWNTKELDDENTTLAVLIAIIFQGHQGYTMDLKTIKILQKLITSCNLWLVYRTARNALRYGQPEMAVPTLEGMSARVSSENMYFWLSGLYSVACGENHLTSQSSRQQTPDLHSRLNETVKLYQQAVMSLKSASSQMTGLQFQIEYVKIRTEMITAFCTFWTSCNTLQLSPPPAIAPGMAITSRDDLLKCGRIITQLRKSVRDFQSISEMYGRLYQTAFDADSNTLLNIQILQQMCLLIARGIEKVVISKDHPSFSDDDQAFNFCKELEYSEASHSWTLVKACRSAVKINESLSELPPPTTVIHKHVCCLKEAVKVLIETPISFPRFFFQTLQMTRVKIAVSPQPRVPGESVPVMSGNNLALKVEDVIQQNGVKGETTAKLHLFRKPKAIRITVISTPSTNTSRMDLMKTNSEPVTLVKNIVPHRDFFTAQFLLNISSGGLTSVTVDTALVDFEGRVWMTGPRAVLNVRLHDEAGSTGKVSLPATRQVPTGVLGSGIRF